MQCGDRGLREHRSHAQLAGEMMIAEAMRTPYMNGGVPTCVCSGFVWNEQAIGSLQIYDSWLHLPRIAASVVVGHLSLVLVASSVVAWAFLVLMPRREGHCGISGSGSH